jgi:uncharacterized membrane protein
LNAAWPREAASASLIGLIGLCLAWELWLAPLHPGGTWLVLKALPLLAPLFGVLRGRVYTYRWASLLIWLYAMEGAARSYTDPAPGAWLAAAELALALSFFASAGLYIRAVRGRDRPA